MLILFIFLLITCTSIQFTNSYKLPSSESHIQYGSYALNALRELLSFFETNANNLNLDGLYGLRVAQGQLNVLDQSLTSSSYFTDKTRIIHLLSIQIERISNISLSEIELKASAYLHRFALVAYKPFKIEYQSRKIRKYLIDHGQRSDEFDEEKSDQCFGELLGSNERTNSTKCSISNSCWDMMTAPMTKDYRLTHQLLWFIIGKNIGCIEEDIAIKKLHSIEDYYCSNIYQDAKYNLINNINQDLFLEQLLLCSIIGYEEFLRTDWLNAILSWQHPEYHCFSDASDTIRFYQKTKRHLLYEQEMNNGCLSHKSGLAAGLLATYSRVFLQ